AGGGRSRGEQLGEDVLSDELRVLRLEPGFPTAAGAAIRIDDLDPELDEVGLLGFRLRKTCLRGTRIEFVIPVEEDHIRRPRGEDSRTARLESGHVLRLTDEADPCVAGGV